MLMASAAGQAPGSSWSKTFGGTETDVVYSVIQTSDGGYALVGYTTSYGAGGEDFWLVKTDSSGNMEWSENFGGTGNERAYSVIQTSDEGYALVGYTTSYGAGWRDFWLVKTDSSGNMEWSENFGGTGSDRAYSVIQTSDEGYALAGYTDSYGAGGWDFWLVKTDSSGNMEWSENFGGTGSDRAYSVIQTSDEGYALAGYTDSYGAGGEDFWLVKADSSGNEKWSKTFGGENDDEAYSVIQTSDGGHALAGYTDSYGAGGEDFWLVKTDSSGNMEWSENFGGTGSDMACSVIQTSDGGYTLAGYTGSYGAGMYDFWLVKTDSSGNEVGSRTFGGAGDDYAYSAVQTSDGGYVIAGSTESYGAGKEDFWLVNVPGPSGGGLIYVAVGAAAVIVVIMAFILYRRSRGSSSSAFSSMTKNQVGASTRNKYFVFSSGASIPVLESPGPPCTPRL